MAIIPGVFTTGFEEHMSTFSQEVRALNPVRIPGSCDGDSCGWVWAMSV